MYIMAGLFIVGFICNLTIRAVDSQWHMKKPVEVDAGVADAVPSRARNVMSMSRPIALGLGMDQQFEIKNLLEKEE